MQLCRHRTYAWWGLAVTAFGVSCLPATSQDAVAGSDAPQLMPGKQVRIPWEPAGGKPITVFLPENYSSDQKWPVIVYYHGLKEPPNTPWLQQATRGRDVVLVGSERVTADGAVVDGVEVTGERTNLRALCAYLGNRASIDRDRVFVCGSSAGASVVGGLLKQGTEGIAGALLWLGASVPTKTDYPDDWPVYIGVGASDRGNLSAYLTAWHCRNTVKNVDLTFEAFPGKGHAIDPQAPLLHGWIEAYVVRRHQQDPEALASWFRETVAQIRSLEDDAEIYRALARMCDDPRLRLCPRRARDSVRSRLDRAARTKAGRAEKRAWEMIWEAVGAVRSGSHDKARGTLGDLLDQFPDSAAAESAKTLLERVSR